MENNIRQFRKRAGLSQQALADAIGVKKAAISKLESGAMQLTLNYLNKLSQALNCSTEDLYKTEAKISEKDALIFAIKEVLKLLLNEDKKPITREKIRKDFIAGLAFFHDANALDAAAVMDDLLEYVEGRQQQEKPQTLQQPLRLVPPV